MKTLNDFEIAARLSYFLWSSMPDDPLREAAASGKLNTPKELRSQVERMLKDPRASALTENFVGQWLHLRKLGEMPPDPEKSRAYYEDNLEEAMREETRRYFQYVLSNNRSILDFIDSDYTFLNPALARHYKIPGVTVEGFQKVSLKPEHHRGGLLGHGSASGLRLATQYYVSLPSSKRHIPIVVKRCSRFPVCGFVALVEYRRATLSPLAIKSWTSYRSPGAFDRIFSITARYDSGVWVTVPAGPWPT
jgi:hypothetical protein